MNNTKTSDNELVSKYLLGGLSDDELWRIEERYFTDEDFFARLLDAENNLVDSYARGELGAGERQRFEQNYLTTPQRRQRVKFAQSLKRANAEAAAAAPAMNANVKAEDFAAVQSSVSWLQTLRNLFSGNNILLPAFGLSALALLIAFGGIVLLVMRSGRNNAIVRIDDKRTVQQANQLPPLSDSKAMNSQMGNQGSGDKVQESQNSAGNNPQTAKTQRLPQSSANKNQPADQTANQSAPSRNNPSESSKEAAAPPQRSFIATFLLAPGLVRGGNGGENNKFVVPPQASRVRLQIPFGQDDEYAKYRATLETPDGVKIWSGPIQKPRVANGGRTGTATLPAKLLTKGDYTLVVEGETGAGDFENAAEYSFSVSKK